MATYVSGDFCSVFCKNNSVNMRPVILIIQQVVVKGYHECPSGLEIISRLAPVKLSGQTYFCSDTTHFWPDKSPLHHISTKFPPSPCSMMFTYQTSTFSKPLLYMEPRTHCRKSGMHGTATTFGKINITFVHASIASVLCLLYR